jgi:hypothetical protein
MTITLKHRSLLTAAVLLPIAAVAQDRADIDRTAIVGNRELPKVLYIVPWKKPLPATLSGRPLASVLDEALAPIDRDVFRRHMAYDAQLAAAQAASNKTPNPEPTPEPKK